MRLRLYHHRDGTRVAYRETGTGPPLVLLHSLGLSHREWEPVVEPLSERFRLVLPDLPLHGDSEDRPRHPYSPDWFAQVIAGFCAETAGPRPLVGGHDVGAELLLRAVADGLLEPRRLVLMPNRLHRPDEHARKRALWRGACKAAALPGLDRVLARGATLLFRPAVGEKLSAQRNPAARDLLRHAFMDVAGNGNRARAWARFARQWPVQPQRQLLDAYPRIAAPTLLLWADRDRAHPLPAAQEALDLLPDGQLRILSATGFLMAYDDPVGLARELISFCG
ncbi:alpha/beta hydrolase [Conexibacter sp. JD483]|uniref:alpha/beta fold hydrolase n=1 Tax=unclassified Conexibacter TaxID=2627773 RepID=UPI002722B006|nr:MULTISPECIES: alpha/beta hydrolase [unclassified Conexibacter]MDO8184347.1 alpha/beta hydrolase [Conexibacter sp. CPCC 205706]MDO8197653.1 alpha/beta hydrolase [Conexibacter sp. CPCC 205762]MDR9368316.1 alpha/beta hydrolase [Conexibacter sp. JD483]